MKAAMILSGCGYLDGAEIRESVLSLLYLDQQDVEVDVFAPDMFQKDVVNHQTGEAQNVSRNVLQEAARISRGHVKPLATLDISEYDGLVIPGGFGVAKTLSDLASKGSECTVLPELRAVIIETVKQQKPIAAICIAPALVAAALKGEASPTLTIGEDEDVAGVIEACGASHHSAQTTDCVVDEEHKIISCSAYMREDSISDVAYGIEGVIEQFVTYMSLEKSAETE